METGPIQPQCKQITLRAEEVLNPFVEFPSLDIKTLQVAWRRHDRDNGFSTGSAVID